MPRAIRAQYGVLRIAVVEDHACRGRDALMSAAWPPEHLDDTWMNDNDLRDLLTQLHTRLGSASTLSAEDRRLLATVLRDISNVLEKDPTAQPPDTSGLESLAVKFEADHPALAEGLRQLVDTLAKAGI